MKKEIENYLNELISNDFLQLYDDTYIVVEKDAYATGDSPTEHFIEGELKLFLNEEILRINEFTTEEIKEIRKEKAFIYHHSKYECDVECKIIFEEVA